VRGIEALEQKSFIFTSRFRYTDEEFKLVQSWMENLHSLGEKTAIANLLPIMRFPLAGMMREIKKIFENYHCFVDEKLNAHKKDYQEGIIRDFADALLAAKDEAIKEKKENAQYLNDFNLTKTLTNFFQAGCKLKK
jgi:hypothetical protein